MDPLFYTEGRLRTLQGRVLRCCCKYCGGGLEIRQIVFSSFEEARVEIFCQDCNRIEYGVEQVIYDNARYFVEELQYTDWRYGQADEKNRRMNIAKVCDILSWGARHWGILTEDGFTIPVTGDSVASDGCVILEDDVLNG